MTILLQRSAWALGAMLVLATLLGCASVSRVLPGRGAESEEVRELKRRVVELEQRATMAEVEVEHLRQLLAEASGASAAGSPPPEPAGPATGPVEIIDVTEGGEAGGALGRSVPPMPAAEPRVEVSDLEPLIIEELPDAPSPVQEEPSGSEAVTEPVSERDSGSQIAAVAVTPDGQALYDRGYTFFHQGRYLDAESTFQQFLAAFGDTDLADNAQFWIGEARFAREDLAGALAAYREVANRYPGANKVPDSLLKSADCLRELGDLEGAVRDYRLVIEGYPSTAAAAVAEERLKEVN